MGGKRWYIQSGDLLAIDINFGFLRWLRIGLIIRYGDNTCLTDMESVVIAIAGFDL